MDLVFGEMDGEKVEDRRSLSDAEYKWKTRGPSGGDEWNDRLRGEVDAGGAEGAEFWDKDPTQRHQAAIAELSRRGIPPTAANIAAWAAKKKAEEEAWRRRVVSNGAAAATTGSGAR
jgi:hypothetical protein